MIANRIFHVIDSHTGGTATRLLMEGIPDLRGKDMRERRRYLETHFDQIRTTLMQEPRGNSGVAAILIPPSTGKADYGLIFCDFRGYVDMCVHGTIGVVTTLYELGLKKSTDSKEILFDTPAGIVQARANISGEKVKSVSVRSVPSFYLGNVKLDFDRFGKLSVDLAFGGNVYAYVNAKEINIAVTPHNLSKLLYAGRNVLAKLRNTKSPLIEYSKKILGVSFYEDIGDKTARNIMIADNDLYDRSPCGTGTCGRMAALNSQGKLMQGEKFVNRSIIGSEFTGKIISSVTLNGKKGIVPEITGSAYLTGICDLIVSKGDKLSGGFMIR